MIYILLLGAGIIAAILGGAVLRSEPLLWVGIVILAAAIALHMIFYRCPHCGRWLNRNFGEYCQFCGKDHSGNLWQKCIGLLHKVLYFFAHLFGKK